MYKPQIKASHIANLTDARYFAAWGAEWMGFTLEAGQEHYIAPAQVAAIKEWVEGPKMVGEFSGLDTKLIEEAITLLGLDGVEVSQFADLEKINQSIPIMVNIVMTPEMMPDVLIELLKQKAKAHYCILDFSKNKITPDIFSPSLLCELVNDYPIFIHPGKHSQTVQTILDTIQPMGLSLAGGAEEKVGLKSFDELDEIFDLLEPLRF